jgi:hypothetical protein
MGEVANAFDGSRDTLLRTLEANPAVFVLAFPEPIKMKGLRIKFGSTEAGVLARLYVEGEPEPKEYVAVLKGSIEQPDGTLNFGAEYRVTRLHLEVKDMRQQEPGHVHLWEIEAIE